MNDRSGRQFIDGDAKANRQKPSGIAAKEMILRVHVVPFLGAKKLDAITNEDVQHLKARLGQNKAKTANNVLKEPFDGWINPLPIWAKG